MTQNLHQLKSLEASAVLDVLPDPAWLSDLRGETFLVNAAYHQQFQTHSTTLEAIRGILPPDEQDRVVQQVLRHLKGKSGFECRVPVLQQGLRVVHDMVVRPLVQNGVQVGWMGILKRLPQHALLQDDQDFLQRLTDEVPATVQLRDMQTNQVLFTNRYSTEVLGYSWDEVKDLTPQEALAFFHPEDLPRLYEVAEGLQHLKDGETLDGEYRMRHRNGEWRWIHARLSIFKRDSAGRPLQSLSVGLDNTERKKAELEVRASEARLQALMEGHTRFVSDASHEIKTPLAGIQGNLEVLLRYPDIPESEKKEIVEDCHREAVRLGRLVTDLLSMARTGQGLLILETTIRLDHLVLDTVRYFESIKGNHDLKIGDMPACTVEGDPDRLKQLLIILIGNALKYTPDGGRVNVGLKCEENQAEVCIQDTGIGISSEDLPRVFERHFRADHSLLGRDPGGSGLGLSIARWIVEAHGGTLNLRSEVGKGTTVRVCLPGVLLE